MKRLSTLILIGFTGLLASCGSSVSSSSQPGVNDVYSVVLTPTQFTLDAGDWAQITAAVDLSKNGAAPKAVTPQPAILYSASDERVTVSPTGLVCAGQWDAKYQNCVPTPTLPTGYVTITAYNPSNNVQNTSLVSIHEHAARITLNSPGYAIQEVVNGQTMVRNCISQNSQVQYFAAPVDANGDPVGNVYQNDYTWTTDNSSIATVSTYGFVVARNPGVTNVYATLNGTQSVPLAFVTCPPNSIVLSTSTYTGSAPVPPYTAADLGPLTIGTQSYVTATMTDVNGNALITAPLTFTSSYPLIGSFGTPLELAYTTTNGGGGLTSVTEETATLSTHTSGRFTMLASCGPPSCNPPVGSFVSPAGASTGAAMGFGYPIYSNVIGTTVQGVTGSTVLVTGTTFTNGNPAHELLVYDSERMTLLQLVSVANSPNSLVVAPNGAAAYVGSSAGLVVINLANYQSTTQLYPIVGGLATDVITGKVLGVSPDSRYVVVSDTSDPNPANHLVFLIDTTGSKNATRYTIPNITSVTFASDDSNFWIGGASGVYVFRGDTFVPTLTNAGTPVTSLAWTPDGQSYLASGTEMINYSTCNDQNPQMAPQNLTSSVTEGLSTTDLSGISHVLGLDGSEWFDYAVTSSSQVPVQPPSTTTPAALTPGGTGNVCLSDNGTLNNVSIAQPVTATSTLQSSANQISFSPVLEQAFVTGVNPTGATPENVIHGYHVGDSQEFTCTTAAPVVPLSGGILNDGRKLYFGTWDSTAQTATLHRIDLATCASAPGTLAEDASASVTLVPSFVAVVPR